MKKLFILLFMLTFYSSGISYATTFSSEDFVGNWSGCFMETTASNTTRVLRHASVVISPTEYAVSGTWSDTEYSNNPSYHGNITGGSLNITPKGEITGSIGIITVPDSIIDTISVINGWMDIDKKLFYIVTERPGGQLSIGMLVKYQHTSNGFPTSDLEGIWFVNNIQSTGNSSGEDEGDWVVNILSAASTGLCTGSWYAPGDSSGTIDAPSSLSLDSSYGWVTGTLHNNLGSQINVYIGQMSSDKNSGNVLTNSDFQAVGGGNLTSGVFLRAGGSGFVSQDLKGTWAMYTTEVYSDTDMYWFYGEITLDQSGKLIKGNWNSSSTHTGTYTSGQINIENSGSLSGTITSNIGYTYIIKKGLLSLSKNHASLTLESTDRNDTAFMIKKSGDTIVPIIHLLIGN